MSDPYIGEIAIFPYGRIPKGWMPCDGRTLQVNTNNALFAVLGNAYGGDGRTNFKLPDLRGRTPVGQGKRGTTSHERGTYGGAETVTLTAAQLPSHTHSLVADDEESVSAVAGNNYFGKVVRSAVDRSFEPLYAVPGPGVSKVVPLNPASVSTVGAAAPHYNMQPYLTLSFCIAVEGLFPDRW